MTTSNWQERFDELLIELQGQTDFSKYIGSFHSAKVKSFITKLLAEREAEIIAMCEEMRKPMTASMYGTIVYTKKDYAYNQAIDDIQTKLTHKEEKV